MNAFLVYRYNIELKKGQLLEVVGTMCLMGCVPAESIYGVVQKLKLPEHKFPGGITHNLHRQNRPS